MLKKLKSRDDGVIESGMQMHMQMQRFKLTGQIDCKIKKKIVRSPVPEILKDPNPAAPIT